MEQDPDRTSPGRQNQKSKFRQSLQGKLVLLLLLLLVPALLIQVYVFLARVETRRSEEFRSNLEIARAVAKAFDSFVKDILHQELAIGIVSTSSFPLNSMELQRLLAESAGDNAAIRYIKIAHPSGNLWASSHPDITSENVSDRDYFREIAGGREWSVSKLLIGKDSDSPFFAISRGISDDKGKLLAVVITAINPERLGEMLGIERTSGAAVSVIDRQGLLVYSRPAVKITWEERSRLNQVPMLEDALAGKEVTGVVKSYEGNDQFFAGTPVASIGWVAGAGRDEHVAMAAIRKTLLPQTTLFLSITIIVFGIAYSFSRKISTMVAQLRDHALALGRGDSQNLAIARGCAELEDLARAFNTMSEEIQDREDERVLADAALRQSEEHFRLVFDKAPIGAIVIGLDYRFLQVNETYCRMTGYSDKELVSMMFLDLIHPEDKECNSQLVQQAIAGDIEQFRLEKRCIRKNGEIIWVTVSGQVIRNPSGGPLHLISMIEDITERKEMETSLREARDELELRVVERTAELTRANEILKEQAASITTLRSLLPICAHCKRIRNDEGYWQQIESYIHQHAGTEFSHGICPECLKKHYSEFLGDKLDKIVQKSKEVR